MKLTPPPIDAAALRAHYRAFLRDDRILLTGHSHQAWPDVARAGVLAAFDDASAHVDDKWGRAMAMADRVRAAVGEQLGCPADQIALGQNTHEMVARFLSALDLRRRPHVVTTAGEFHSMRRQLTRLAEAGLEVTAVPVQPIATLAGRLAQAIRPDTAALMASTVLFQSGSIVPGLAEAVSAAHAHGAEVLLDAYHAYNALPQRLSDLGPDPIFVCGGGYKYAQWGEGNCWLRVPAGAQHRPIYTGWFSDFAGLAKPQTDLIGYGRTGADRFAGSTYDPTSQYRAAAVIDFFAERGLSIERLRAHSIAQTRRLVELLATPGGVLGDQPLELAGPRDAHARGAFVALRHAQASALVAELRSRGVFADARGEVLRLGPAPYTTDTELLTAADAVAAAVRAVARGR